MYRRDFLGPLLLSALVDYSAQLPDEIWIMILGFLPNPAMTKQVSLVSRRFLSFCQDDSLWRTYYIRNFGEYVHTAEGTWKERYRSRSSFRTIFRLKVVPKPQIITTDTRVHAFSVLPTQSRATHSEVVVVGSCVQLINFITEKKCILARESEGNIYAFAVDTLDRNVASPLIVVGRTCKSGTTGCAIEIYDSKLQQCLKTIGLPQQENILNVRVDSQYIYAVGTGGSVWILSVETGKQVAILHQSGTPRAIASSLRHGLAVSGGDYGSLYWWDLKSFKQAFVFKNYHSDNITNAFLSDPDGRLFTSSWDHTIGVCSLNALPSGQAAATLEPFRHTWRFYNLYYDTGSRTLIGGSWPDIVIYDYDTHGSQLAIRTAHDSQRVSSVFLTGLKLLSASDDLPQVKVWDFATTLGRDKETRDSDKSARRS